MQRRCSRRLCVVRPFNNNIMHYIRKCTSYKRPLFNLLMGTPAITFPISNRIRCCSACHVVYVNPLLECEHIRFLNSQCNSTRCNQRSIIIKIIMSVANGNVYAVKNDLLFTSHNKQKGSSIQQPRFQPPVICFEEKGVKELMACSSPFVYIPCLCISCARDNDKLFARKHFEFTLRVLLSGIRGFVSNQRTA